MKDYYNILGVSKDASQDEIKRTYRKLAHKYHPDKQGGDEKKFKEVNEAYQALGDAGKRQQYDRYGSTAFNGSAGGGSPGGDFSSQFDGADFGDIFEDLFSGFSGRGRASDRQQRKRGRDMSIDIDVSFSESVFGSRRGVLLEKVSQCDACDGRGAAPKSAINKCEICKGTGTTRENRRSIFGTFTSLVECPQCFGKGEIPEQSCSACKGKGVLRKQENIDIEVPSGIRNGEAIKFTGMGEAVSGGVSGDLYVKVRVLPHPVFRREGNDLLMDMHLSVSKMMLGGEERVETLDGKIEVKIPELSKAGDFLRIREKGVATMRGRRGDLLIRLFPKMPKKLSRKAKELLEELGEEGL
jgi:molecular chaperone DnaJ